MDPDTPLAPSARLKTPAGVPLVADDGSPGLLPARKRMEAPLLLTAVVEPTNDLDMAAQIPAVISQARVPWPKPRFAPSRAHPNPYRPVGGGRDVGAEPLRSAVRHQARVLYTHHPATGSIYPTATARPEGPMVQGPDVPRLSAAPGPTGAAVATEVVRPPTSANRETRLARKAAG